jgi:hypothetical protein
MTSVDRLNIGKWLDIERNIRKVRKADLSIRDLANLAEGHNLYVSALFPAWDRKCGRCWRPFLPCLLAIAFVEARIPNYAVDH